MFAPQSIGLCKKGVARVLSTTKGILYFLDMLATFSISTIDPSGFDKVS